MIACSDLSDPVALASVECRRARPLLGTLVEISAVGRNGEACVNEAFRAVEEVHALMSYHDLGSDVSRLNQSACRQDIEVHPWTWEVLAAAKEISLASGGLFDVTVAPTLVRIGFLPRHRDMPRAMKAEWYHIELLEGNGVRFHKPLRIDLGGIAKGFAVDRAVAVLKSAGVESGRVNAGGDLRLFGTQRQLLHVRHPEVPERLLPLLETREAAAATSAGYFAARRRGNRLVTPVIHPVRRRAIDPGRSVTVIAEDCMTADALTKVVMSDPPAAEAVLTKFGARAVVLEAGGDGRIDVTLLPSRCSLIEEVRHAHD